jgi:type II secretory pathway component GspD/PulD (secretin)
MGYRLRALLLSFVVLIAVTAEGPYVAEGAPMGVVLTTLAARAHVTVIVDPTLAAQPVTGSWRWQGFATTAREIVAEAGGSLIEHHGVWYAIRGMGEVRTIPLTNADPQQVAAALQQADPSVRVLAAPKSVILIGQIGDLLQAEGIVRQLDHAQDQYVVIPTHGVSADALTKIAQTLGAALSGGHVTADPVHGTIIVTGSPQAIALARALAPQMVQNVQTLAIHVAAIDYVPRDDNVHLGAIFQQGANGSPFQFLFPLSSTAPFTAILNLLRSHGEAKVLSDITITDLSGSEKKLNLGEQYPVVIPNGGLNGGYTQGQTINTGLTIDVTPIAGADGGVTAALSFSFLRVLGTNQLGIPITSGEEDSGTYFFTPQTHLLLTGLSLDQESSTTTKVPVLGDLFLFGKLFRATQSSVSNEQLILEVDIHPLADGTSPSVPAPIYSTPHCPTVPC